MPTKHELNPAEQELERVLTGLKPATTRLDRDRLMFRAGQASVPRTSRAWPVLTGLLAGLVAVSWWFRPPFEDRSVRIAQAENSPNPLGNLTPWQSWPTASVTLLAEERVPIVAADSYQQLRNLVFAEGVESLPLDATGLQSDSIQVWSPLRSARTDTPSKVL